MHVYIYTYTHSTMYTVYSIHILYNIITDSGFQDLRIKQCHKPPMTGNGKHITCENGDDWGMVD